MTETQSDPQTILSEFAHQGECDRATLLDVIRQLEQQQKQAKNLADLAGNWQLLWTSGTKNLQKLQKNATKKKIVKSRFNILQTIETEPPKICSIVTLGILVLRVCGSFAYRENKIDFVFERTSLKLGILPAIAFPMGQGATGWLKTTYLDENWHIERGDRGGISIYYLSIVRDLE